MKRTKFLMVVALALVIFLPVTAGADMWQGGPYYENGVNPFTTAYVGPFDKVEEFVIDNGIHWAQNWTGVLPSTWVSSLVNPTYIVATGNQVSRIDWTEWYSANPAGNGFYIDELVWRGDTLLYGVRYLTSGTSPLVIPSGQTYDRSPVPLPPTVLLLGSGILGLVGLGWRRRKES